MEQLSLGNNVLRLVPVDDHFKIDQRRLRAAWDGHRPFCAVGVAEKTNSGASDDLEALAGLVFLNPLRAGGKSVCQSLEYGSGSRRSKKAALL